MGVQIKPQVILVVIACLSGLLHTVQFSYGQTSPSRTGSPPIDEQTPAQVQEALVQHLIRGALSQNDGSPRLSTTTKHRPSAQTENAVSPLRSETTSAFTPPDLTAATVTMVSALAVILLLLGMATYVIRRYLLKPAAFGQDEPTLRVLARINLTPKATIALLEVPGKLLVIGASGTHLFPLGEAPTTPQERINPQEQNAERSFASTLEEQSQRLQSHDMTSDHLMRMPEEIQRKVSRLKQL